MHCCGVEGALFTHVGHPVDQITTIGDIGCGGRVGLGRDVVDLTFEHVVKEIRCFYAEYFVDIFLWQCDRVMLISREKIWLLPSFRWGPLTVNPKGGDRYDTSCIVTSIEWSHDC